MGLKITTTDTPDANDTEIIGGASLLEPKVSAFASLKDTKQSELEFEDAITRITVLLKELCHALENRSGK